MENDEILDDLYPKPRPSSADAREDGGDWRLLRKEHEVRRGGDDRRLYRLQAALAACHARAETAEETDWKRIAALYGELEHIVPSPVIALNRAVAISRAEGPTAGLALLDALATEPALARYHLLPSARADLLEKLGRHSEARAEFERAVSLVENERQRARLLTRAKTCARAGAE